MNNNNMNYNDKSYTGSVFSNANESNVAPNSSNNSINESINSENMNQDRVPIDMTPRDMFTNFGTMSSHSESIPLNNHYDHPVQQRFDNSLLSALSFNDYAPMRQDCFLFPPTTIRGCSIDDYPTSPFSDDHSNATCNVPACFTDRRRKSLFDILEEVLQITDDTTGSSTSVQSQPQQ